MKLLFEASILSCFNEKSFGRSGIYFVAVEILKQFALNTEYEITLFCENEYYNNLKLFAEKYYPSMPVKTKKQSVFNRFCSNKIDFLKSLRTKSILLKIPRKASVCFFKSLLVFDKAISFISDYLFFSSYDVFFSPFRKAPECILCNKKIRKFLMIHDFISAKFPPYLHMKENWMNIAWKGINKNDRYICISDNTKKDLLSLFSFVSEKQILVNYNGINERFFEGFPQQKNDEILQKYNLKSKSYMFSIGSLVEHKNLKKQIKAFAAFIKETGCPDFYYVITGPSSGYNNLLEELNIDKELHTHFKFTGYAEDDEVPVLYANALWTSFTSLYEGFGLPALEAMSSGCPLVTSNTTSLPEICMDAAVMIDPESEEEHIKAYKRLYSDSSLRDELIKKGLERSKAFTWENSVKGIMNFIDAACVES